MGVWSSRAHEKNGAEAKKQHHHIIRGQQAKTVEECLPLEEREMKFMETMMGELMRLNELATDEETMKKVLEPIDNSCAAGGFAHFTPLLLPKDDEGYVVSFDANDAAGISEFFEAFGLVVVHSVADREACHQSREEFWDLMERSCKGLDRTDPMTWDRWCMLKNLGFAGMDCTLSPQHCKNRVSKPMHSAFSAVFGRPDLHVNIGRLGAMRPTVAGPIGGGSTKAGSLPVLETDCPQWRTLHGEKWLHWDLNPWTGATSSFSWHLSDPLANRGYVHRQVAVQGVLALADCGQASGGFLCIPGSHKVCRGWAHSHHPNDYRMNSPEGPMQLQIGEGDPLAATAQTAPIREGSLLLWSAELAHANYPNHGCSMRLVQYIQMKPADDEVLLPLLDDASLLPSAAELELDALGRRLLAIEPW